MVPRKRERVVENPEGVGPSREAPIEETKTGRVTGDWFSNTPISFSWVPLYSLEPAIGRGKAKSSVKSATLALYHSDEMSGVACGPIASDIVLSYGSFNLGDKMKRIALVLAMMVLAGCQQVSEMSYTEYRALAIQKNKDCIAQGIKPNTEEMKACVMHELRREDATRQANQQRRMAAAAAMQAMSNGYNASAASYGQSVSRPVTCTSRPQSTFVGGAPSQINTTCY